MDNSTKHPKSDSDPSQLNENHSPGMEALTLDELDEFMKRAKARAADFAPAQRQTVAAPEVVEEVAVHLAPERLANLLQNFYPELPGGSLYPRRLVQGVILDFDNTLARLKQPIDGLMESGARQAEAYMRSTGMDFPEDRIVFSSSIPSMPGIW